MQYNAHSPPKCTWIFSTVKLLTHCHLPEAGESWRREAKDYKEEERFSCCHLGGGALTKCCHRLRNMIGANGSNGQAGFYLVEMLSHQVVGRDWWLVMCIRAGPAAAAPPVQPTIGDWLSAVVLQYQWIHWTVLAEQQNSFDQFPQKSILTMDIKVKAACASTTWVKLVSCFTIWKDTEAINRIHIFLDSQASSSSCKVLFA